MKVIVIPNYTRDKTKEALIRVIDTLKSFNCSYDIDSSEGKRIESKDYDLMISLGGDGTFLRTAHIAYKYDIPIVGINTGHAGCLTNISIDDIEKDLGNILNTKPKDNCDKNIVLVCDRNKKEEIAINEVSFTRVTTPTIFKVMLGDNVIFDTFATGLIFCTPLGSSGYNQSAGGELINRSDNKFEATAICPVQKANRNIILDADNEYTIIANNDVYSSVDGNEAIIIPGGEKTIVRKATKKLSVKRNS